ncbi:tyrosine-type recombinase/integrase [Clavibacter capsici]|uniref:tyrosine-type recombinase/integrase n=1 Tax=Clavibacter capsici TaxID=1874630 RepID=UPI00142862F8|nr:tyrosine-type recombinase/integrase [Clavibacter capsici]QIS39077.1 tyrosine-type recombinase/integrase [Clavibacter capsici]
MSTPKTRKVNRAAFGTVRQLPSGRWQARYPDEAGRPMRAPHTFETKAAAMRHLAEVQADRSRGRYIDHRDGAQHFGPFARAWIEGGGSRGKLAPRTTALYLDVLDRQLVRLHAMPLSAITGQTVRDWYTATRRELAVSAASRGGTGERRLQQAYALLRSILATAAADRLIGENPCRIKGAGLASAPERPYLSPAHLGLIEQALPVHYYTVVRVMFGAHLRLGEAVGLQRRDLDRERGVLRVERQVVSDVGEALVTGTKTGTARDVVLPRRMAEMLADHLDRSIGFPGGAMFLRPDGRPITRSGLQRAWAKAAAEVGLPQFHLHDVRHAGLTVAAQAGATTRELMARGGHRTTAAAMTYQHVAEERASLLAERMESLLDGTLGGASGTQVARGPVPNGIRGYIGLAGMPD